MEIRAYTLEDKNEIWEIFLEVISQGSTYVFSEDTTEEAFETYWLASNMKTFVIERNDEILGTYIIKPNQPGRGSHIANCSYMVKSSARRMGIGDKLCTHSIKMAKRLGYSAIQFNMVVSTNKGALQLWKNHGFKIIGEVPKAFNHKQLGLTNAFILWREV